MIVPRDLATRRDERSFYNFLVRSISILFNPITLASLFLLFNHVWTEQDGNHTITEIESLGPTQ